MGSIKVSDIQVVKRDGREVPFDGCKIEAAIVKAMRMGSGSVSYATANRIASYILNNLIASQTTRVSVPEIEGYVFDSLVESGEKGTARAYEGYRKIREYQKTSNKVDDYILGIVDGSNKEAMEENSNKDAYLLSTQRDLIAGEISKDITMRMLLPTNIVEAHESGIIHQHDADYFVQSMFNCDLVNLKDMLTNGTVINKKMIEPPKSFHTACTVATQVVQQIANGQYGGQTISLAHLSPFVRISFNKHLEEVEDELKSVGLPAHPQDVEKIALKRLKQEVKSGIQTIQYQVNTFSSSNGQAPFLSVFMYLNEDPDYVEETAMLIQELLEQRYLGMKNELGVYVSPSFPKLLYVLDENNVPKDSEYRALTDLAVKTVAKRMMPDFISAKKMKENYEGNVFPCMGCRSFLSPWKDENDEYKWYARFNQGVTTINLPDIGLSANKDINKFWEIFDDRLQLCFEALMLRHEALRGTISDVSPIHWQHGGISRLKKGETIDKYLFNGYSTISLGYIGVHECVLALTGKSITSPEGEALALDIMHKLKDTCDKWKAETTIGFAPYGSPSESTTYKFATKLRERFGVIEGITDKDYITNSYHVPVKEEIDPFEKLRFESQFQDISTGGSVSYVEVSNMSNNLDALSQLVDYMYDTIQYAEINTKSDYCHECGFSGEILLDKDYKWYCPNCGNREHSKMNVCRRTCG